MSTDENTSYDSDTSIDDENTSETSGLYGYQFEPEYTEKELNERVVATQIESTVGLPSVHERGADTSWCKCSVCTIMPTFRESSCCQEFEHYVDDYMNEEVNCITQHCEFSVVCLHSTVLETAYIAFLRYKRHTGRAPDSLSPR